MSEMTAEQQAEAAEKRKKDQLERERRNRLQVMSSPAGREFVFEVLDHVCGLYSQSYAGADTHATAFAEGQRSVGLHLQQVLQRECPEEYSRMMVEAFKGLSAPGKHVTDQDS